MGSELVKPDHLNRKAVVYVRQSTPHQVITNRESLKLQYALSQSARELGWREADIDVIDSDLGQSGAGAAHWKGFKDLVARVTLGEVGLFLSMNVTRLARNCSDWYPLLDVCRHRRCLVADRDGVYDPGTPNARLLLGLKGTISELELHTIRSRMTAGRIAKAERGDLVVQLPAGLVRAFRGGHQGSQSRGVGAPVAALRDLPESTDGRASDAGLFWPRLGSASLRPPWRSALAACDGVGRDGDPEESGLCRRLCLWKDLVEAAQNTGRASTKVSASWNGLKDRCEGKVLGLYRLRNPREDPGDAARQSCRIPAH